MIIRGIRVNDDGFCAKCPYQFEESSESSHTPPSRSTCTACRREEKDHRIIFSELGVVTHLGAKYIVCCDSAGYMGYELPDNLRVMVVEK